jgi:hypothetical protein
MCALTRRNDGALSVAFHQGSDLTPKIPFKFSRKFLHNIQRKPRRQLHLKKGFMMTINVEIMRTIISQGAEKLPTDWTTAT